MMRSVALLLVTPGFFAQALASFEVEPTGGVTRARDLTNLLQDEPTCFLQEDLETRVNRERELTSLLQAQLENYEGERAAKSVRFFLGKGKGEAGQTPAPTPAAAAPATPQESDNIPPSYWTDAKTVLNRAGYSTPIPAAASINAPPKPPTPLPWQNVLEEPAQPLDTKVGAEVMNALSGKPTQTPPPTQDATDMEFVAQCPMVLFNRDISIRAPSCNLTRGQWIDTSPLNTRTVLRWSPLPASGLRFGVDSALSGKGAALFADITQELTLNTYRFVLKNCLGVDRWHIEEYVYKVDSMGKVSSTMELHDVNLNSVAYFYRYLIKKPDGVVVAESTLYRMDTKEVNFTAYSDGVNTGTLLATAKKLGSWEKDGWKECMAPTSPRGWDIHFPVNELVKGFKAGAQPNTTKPATQATQATVQDIRVALAGAITLMGHRDENRGTNGINTEGRNEQLTMFAGGITLGVMLLLLLCNFCLVFKGSGLKDKLKKTLFDSEGAFLPKRPHSTRAAPLHPTY